MSIMPKNILTQRVEELSINAWPALQSLLYDGWVLRFANGYTRRANSVNPLYPSTSDLNEKISACEQLYRREGLTTVFKMTMHSMPAELDRLLAERGYRTDADTSVQLLNLGSLPETPAPAVELAEDLTQSWLAAYCRMSDIRPADQVMLEQMLRLILPARRFASVTVDGRVIACGLGVFQDGYIGFSNIVIDSGTRRQGYARQLVHGLLTWGKSQGAHHGYLQVMLNNPPALALYAHLGFQETYRYWYRVDPQVPA
jgi:ribosomal protein S18 acetylase RimI-like enzyme